jgi:hypothetical protein
VHVSLARKDRRNQEMSKMNNHCYSLGTIVKVGKGHYRVVHKKETRGKANSGERCVACGGFLTKKAQGPLCANCGRVSALCWKYLGRGAR